MRPSLDGIDVERLSPQSRWALEYLAFPKADEDVDDRELAKRHGVRLRIVKRMLDDLYAELRAQQMGAVLPDLTLRDMETLREQIERHGQLYPVLVDQHGRTLDGHNRERILTQVGIEPWYHTVHVADEEDARAKSLVANLSRRQLDSRNLRRLAAAEIIHDPTRSDRSIAELLGVHRNTVGRARKELLKLGVVSHGDTRTGKDGVEQPSGKRPRQPSCDEREALVGRTIVEYVVQVTVDGQEHTIVTLDDGRRYELLELEEAS